MENKSNEYQEIPAETWNAESVFQLKISDRLGLLRNLVAVIESDDNTDDWKGELLRQLLLEETVPKRRAAIWSSLSVYARGNNGEGLDKFAKICWGAIEASEIDSSSLEFETMENFLEDARIFGDTECVFDSCRILEKGQRFNAFRWIRSTAAAGDFSRVIPMLLTLNQSDDFVIRESVANAIGLIYSRADATEETLGSQQPQLQSVLKTCLSDPSWYVRRSAEIALFFEQQFLLDPT